MIRGAIQGQEMRKKVRSLAKTFDRFRHQIGPVGPIQGSGPMDRNRTFCLWTSYFHVRPRTRKNTTHGDNQVGSASKTPYLRHFAKKELKSGSRRCEESISFGAVVHQRAVKKGVGAAWDTSWQWFWQVFAISVTTVHKRIHQLAQNRRTRKNHRQKSHSCVLSASLRLD